MPKESHVRVVTFLKRKPGMSPEDFKRYYESRHALLATELVPGMIDYRRLYVSADRPAFGTVPPEPDFDVITTLVFKDRAAYERAFAALKNAEIARQIARDEEQLFDRTNISAYIVEDYASKL